MTSFTLDSTASRIRVRTYAEGFLARAAHDLELLCTELTGSAESDEHGKATGEVRLPIHRVDVHGVLRGETVDPNVLSASDRKDCLEKMRSDAFGLKPHDTGELVAHATLEGRGATLTIRTPKGTTVTQSVALSRRDTDDGRIELRGSFPMSLRALGSKTIKGPLNAFRVADQIDVFFELVLTPRR